MGAEKESGTGFSKVEREAMKTRAAELAADKRAGKKREDGEKAVLSAIAAMEAEDKVIAEGIHALVKRAAPDLWPKTWYGMPAYAKEGSIICFFQAAKKFGSRYATFGFNDGAKLDDGSMWPTSFAVRELTTEVEKALEALLTKALR